MSQEELIHKIVDEISFGLISPKDLRKQSVVEIQTPDTYDANLQKSFSTFSNQLAALAVASSYLKKPQRKHAKESNASTNSLERSQTKFTKKS